MIPFSFDPVVPEASLIAEPLLEVPKRVTRLQAASALRSYIRLAANGGKFYPGLSIGRIHVPVAMLAKANNVHGGPQEAMRMLTIPVQGDNGLEGSLLLFSDRSAIVTIKETGFGAEMNQDLHRVLPVVLQLRRNIETLHDRATYQLNLSARTPDLMVPGRYRHELQLDLKTLRASDDALRGPGKNRNAQLYPPKSDQIELQLIRTLLAHTAARWMQRIEASPLVIPAPQAKPVRGTLGVDLPAPQPDLEGRAYHWPSVMPHLNFDLEKFERAKKAFHMAFVYLHHLHRDEIDIAGIAVMAGQRNQDGTPGKIEIDLRAQPRQAGHIRRDLEAKLKKSYRKLLTHPALPADLFTMEATAEIDAERKGQATTITPATLYHGETSECASKHEQLAAYALFTGPDQKDRKTEHDQTRTPTQSGPALR